MTPSKIKSVAVLGAGPSGLATAKYLLAENYFEKIDVFEQASRSGGVWNYSSPGNGHGLSVPQTSPHVPLEEPLKPEAHINGAMNGDDTEVTFVSPIYDRLETNIPHFLMQFHDKPFPKDIQLFPPYPVVTQYLHEYAEDIRHLISFHVQVVDVRLKKEGSEDVWIVKTKNLKTQAVTEGLYDAVVVATGHYSVPYVPDVKGISHWDHTYPGIISHSKFYRRPETFKDKKVVVVGNSASGIDVAAQVSQFAKKPVLQSQESESYMNVGPVPSWKEELPRIVEFLPPETYNKAIRFENGRIEEGVDAIVFCTGYFYSFPFLSSLEPPLISDGTRTQHVFKHLFYIDHPTLAFSVLMYKIIPFPLAESQAVVLARIWAGRLSLPDKADMSKWEQAVISEKGAGKRFHEMTFPKDAEYLDEMHDWAEQATLRDGLEREGKGKEGPKWSDKQRWFRGRFPLIKAAFLAQGEGRRNIKTMEELGFDYEAWQNNEQEENIV